ncbi:MAG: acylphosphatase [Planctomycetes bacterium]|nr:acylphosphatase [Planctomycetota bacterium]
MTERVVFSGRVQGVGFRYTTRNLAKRHPVTGYVKNLPDGTVELVVQGATEAINGLLLDIAESFRGQITGTERTVSADSEKYREFDIRF